jgi:hypothetical protein
VLALVQPPSTAQNGTVGHASHVLGGPMLER